MSSSTAYVESSSNPVFTLPQRRSTMAAPTTIPEKASKNAASKQHKRSRSGCFTCRLRRKKCDEIRPACKACKHLGLRCDYKRPNWWGNSEQRRSQKDYIKSIIKRTQVAKKTTQNAHKASSLGSATPPGLCHSISTPEGYSDSAIGSYTHSRAASTDQSPLSSDPGWTNYSPDSYFHVHPAHSMLPRPPYSMFSPYDLDVKTERQIFVNDIQTRRDSTLSSFSAFQTPLTQSSGTSPNPSDTWVQQEVYESSHETFPEESIDFDFFDLPHEQITPTRDVVIEVDECDRPLLNHFRSKVSKLLFPILDATHHGAAQRDVIIPALEANPCYRHCCLSVSGMHMKAVERQTSEDVDNDIMRHRYSTISELCTALDQDVEHEQILEATLAMIYFPSSIVRPDDVLPDVPWHQHLQAAKSLVEKLSLQNILLTMPYEPPREIPFNMTLTAWIDILGGTMQGKSPIFANTYRELNIAKRTAGLAELMGCDDNLMFLISEIACLEERKIEGFDEVKLCTYIALLGNQISFGESESPASVGGGSPRLLPAMSENGVLAPHQLIVNITAVFRLAARLYLISMVPGFDVNGSATLGLVESFVIAVSFVPSGPEGFDRSLAWPLVMAGSVSTAGSTFRTAFEERCSLLGDMANIGSFGRVKQILQSQWVVNDFSAQNGLERVHWRDIMVQKGWDCLLI